MKAPQIGVLAMQGDVPEHIDALAAVGAQARAVRTTGDLPGLDALVLPGGESTVIARLATYRGLLEPIRASIAAGMPVFGSCAGMILLAGEVLDAAAGQVTLGGMDITVRRNAFGRQVDSFEEDLHAPDLLAGHEPERPVRAVYIRAPWVEHAGEGVEVLARVGSGPAGGRIVAVRQGALMATAFHPEISSDRRIHRVFLEMVAATLA